MLNKNIKNIIVTFVALTLVVPSVSYAQDKDAPEEAVYNCGKHKGKVSVSFKPEVEIKDLVTWAMGFTCKNFVFAPGVISRKGKVTIIAPKKMSKREAWNLFLTSMEAMKLTVVPKGNVLKIVEIGAAKKETLPVYTRGGPSGAQMIRLVVRPENISPEDATAAFNALVSKDGAVTSLPKSGVLIVTDYGDSIRKMKQILREIDVPNQGEQLYMIKIKHGDATELSTKLTEILGVGSTTGSAAPARNRRRGRNTRNTQTSTSSAKDAQGAIPKRLMAEERSNSLIVVGSPAAYQRVRALVQRIDVPLDGVGGGRVHVHYLDNADAEEMSNTLTSVISGVQQQSSNNNNNNNRRAPARRTRTATAAASSSGPAFEGDVNVAFDKPTNSLVIIASIRDFHSLRDVIRRLDIPRKQVFIEAYVLEVNVSNNMDLGTSFHGGDPDSVGDGIVLGGLQHSDLSSLNVASLATQSGLLGGLIGPLLPGAEQLLGTSIPSFGVLFQALAGSGAVNIVSTPHMLTTDNEEAEESIGENIPYLDGLAGGGAAGQISPFAAQQSVRRRDIELLLKVTPHVSQSGNVRMEIELKNEDIASANFGGLGASWSTRELKTVVTIPDQETAVLGGMMSEKEEVEESKIPILGDIPVLGSLLFKYKKKSRNKTNLLLMITPYVIHHQSQLADIRTRKELERMEFIRAETNFDATPFSENLDYRKKRGMVEEVISTARRFERERKELEELDKNRVEFEDGAVNFVPDDKPADGESEVKVEGVQ